MGGAVSSALINPFWASSTYNINQVFVDGFSTQEIRIMPIYEKLQITSSHTAAARAKNRRIAFNLLRLRQRLRDHFHQEDSYCQGTEQDQIRDSARLVRLATWNIREFDSEKYGKRLEESL
jgi:hypothetical protein